MPPNSPADWTDAAQAWGSIIAILVAIGVVAVQEVRREIEAKHRLRDLGNAAAAVAHRAAEKVMDRLQAAYGSVEQPTLYAVRGYRTTEMVEAMRELNIADLPAKMVEPYVTLRGALYATNSRITDVFSVENRKPLAKARRVARLESAARVFSEVSGDLSRIRAALGKDCDPAVGPLIMPEALAVRIADAVQKKSSGRASSD